MTKRILEDIEKDKRRKIANDCRVVKTCTRLRHSYVKLYIFQIGYIRIDLRISLLNVSCGGREKEELVSCFNAKSLRSNKLQIEWFHSKRNKSGICDSFLKLCEVLFGEMNVVFQKYVETKPLDVE